MVITLYLLAFVLFLRTSDAWTYTEYISTLVTEVYQSWDSYKTFTTAVTVAPTGPVSPTSTNITTTLQPVTFFGVLGFLEITVTDLHVGPNQSVCTPDPVQSRCSAKTTATTPVNIASTPTTIDYIETQFWVELTVSNPSTCTKTSFTYTTSTAVFRQGFPTESLVAEFPNIFNQATDTGLNGAALLVTTHVVTATVNLGGQAQLSTWCEIWLKGDAFVSAEDRFARVKYYLSQCVDPRQYLCGTVENTHGTCGTDWVGTYGPTAVATTTGGGNFTTTTGSGTRATATATKASGVMGGRDLLCESFILTILIATASSCILLC